MLAESILLLGFLLLGAAVQLAGAPPRLRDAVWIAFPGRSRRCWSSSRSPPSTSTKGLGRALGAVILASWLVGLTGYGYARLVSSERDERGALTLAAGFGNTGFVGFPLAQLAYGAEGLTLAVLYDLLSWLLPA